MSLSGFSDDPPLSDGLRSIAVFRALQLGDLLCAVPALRALRHAAPQAQITLIGLPWAESFAARYREYIDDFIEFPGFPGLPESTPDLGLIPHFFAAVQARRFDLALQMHGRGDLSNPITLAFGAARTAGFVVPGAYCPDARLFMAWSDEDHEILRCLKLLRFLGAQGEDSAIEFPLAAADYHALRTAVPELPAPGRYVCIHPGARLPSRRWLPERFAGVADDLADRGWQIVLTGSADERSVVDAVMHCMRAPVLDLSGRTSLGALGALIADAGVVICNDTGASHLAAALKTPSVVICSGSDPGRWAPLNKHLHRMLYAPVACRPCAHPVCPIGHPCATEVGADQVLREALGLCERRVVP